MKFLTINSSHSSFLSEQSYADMTKRARGDGSTPSKRARFARRPVRRRRRIGRARPMRSLKTSYRSLNVYRFVRETLPQSLAFSLIPSGDGYGVMGYLNFDNLQMNQLPGESEDLGKLFARYKVDKIVTVLTPMAQYLVDDGDHALNSSHGLEITRVNTKYMTNSFPIASTAGAQLTELAQLQSKSTSQYHARKPLTIVTVNPGVAKKAVVDSTGAEIDSRGSCPWLSWNDADVPLAHNSIIFARRIDGQDLSTSWKYNVTHKVYFRCSQVG